jgi:hypothetical protein
MWWTLERVEVRLLARVRRLELVILWAPLCFLDANSRWFVPAEMAAGILAALNFIWFMIVSSPGPRGEHPHK